MKFVGPPLETGPLPALIYFSLSETESLETPPFNTPVTNLEDKPLRIFSFTLPHHENGARDISQWTEEVVTAFVHKVAAEVRALLPHITCLSVAGLSRGACIACRLASLVPEIKFILGYAPMIQFLDNCIEPISDRSIRFYIGNNDTRVGTERVFAYIHALAKSADAKRIRTSPIELIMGPSIGRDGHGTSDATFQHGTDWLWEKLSSF